MGEEWERKKRKNGVCVCVCVCVADRGSSSPPHPPHTFIPRRKYTQNYYHPRFCNWSSDHGWCLLTSFSHYPVSILCSQEAPQLSWWVTQTFTPKGSVAFAVLLYWGVVVFCQLFFIVHRNMKRCPQRIC